MKTEYTLSIEPEDTLVRGNVLASGDDEVDRQAEDEIIARLERGDDWAWCVVTVTCTITLASGHTYEGRAHLGGCSYESEADFRAEGGYYPQLEHEAFEDAVAQAQQDAERGVEAAALLAEIR